MVLVRPDGTRKDSATFDTMKDWMGDVFFGEGTPFLWCILPRDVRPSTVCQLRHFPLNHGKSFTFSRASQISQPSGGMV